MDWGQIKSGIMDRLLTAVAMLAVGWFLGTSETSQIKSDLRDMQGELTKSTPRRNYLGDVGNRTEFLCNESKPCRARFQPLQVPE